MALLPATILLCLKVPFVSHNMAMQIQAENVALRRHSNNYKTLILTSLKSCAYYRSKLPHKEHEKSGDTEGYKMGSDNLSRRAPTVKRNQLKGDRSSNPEHIKGHKAPSNAL